MYKKPVMVIWYVLFINIQLVHHTIHIFCTIQIVFTEQTIIKHSADNTAIPQAWTLGENLPYIT